jgi:carbon monoxide dehydrogenase subunit G
MELEQQFTIPTDIDHAWKLLNDVEGIAPCFPGAKVISATEESVEGQVKVKLGPVVLTYGGTLRFVERDELEHRLVMDGQGTDTKGNGSASAKVSARLTALTDGSTRCDMVTDLNVTGRPAQFGRGMMLEIGNNILGKFSKNLAAMLTAEEDGDRGDLAGDRAAAAPAAAPDVAGGSQRPAPAAASTAAPGARRAARVEREDSLDLLSAAGGATAKRVLPVLVGVAVVIAVIVWVAVK